MNENGNENMEFDGPNPSLISGEVRNKKLDFNAPAFGANAILIIGENINQTFIKNAGGKFVESRLKQCTDTFKAKWDKEILKGKLIFHKNITIFTLPKID